MLTEQHFLDEMIANPDDDLPRLAMADWLEEQGDPRAELMRLQHQLRKIDVPEREKLEERMQELLYVEKVPPVVPTITNSIGMKFALIPSGEFMMGSPHVERDEGYFEDQIRIELPHSYFVGITLITQKHYFAVMKHNPSIFQKSNFGFDHPVEKVSWSEMNHFCLKLTELISEETIGRKYELLTEAECEFACRGGTTSPFYFGSCLNYHLANFDTEYPFCERDPKQKNLEATTPVGIYPPNSYGLFDMHGNVWESCKDFTNETLQICKGGCWDNPSWECTSDSRFIPEETCDGIGFRIKLILIHTKEQ